MEVQKTYGEESLPAETHSFRFSEEDLRILYKKTIKPTLTNFIVWLILSLLFVSQMLLLHFFAKEDIPSVAYFAFGMAFTLTALYFFTLYRHKKSWNKMKDLRLATEYHYDIFSDCITLRLIRDGKLCYLRRINYSNIKNIQIFPDHYSFIHDNEMHIIFRKNLKEDSLIPKIIEQNIKKS